MWKHFGLKRENFCMNTHPDFEEFLRLLEKHRVDYMIVGGYAVAFHGYPRFTKDIDVFYSDDQQNIQNLRSALADFGFAEKDVPSELFHQQGSILHFGIEPVRIDLLNRIDGVGFSDARKEAVRGRYGKIEVTFIGKQDLRRNKRSTGRIQDAADLEKLDQRDG